MTSFRFQVFVAMSPFVPLRHYFSAFRLFFLPECEFFGKLDRKVIEITAFYYHLHSASFIGFSLLSLDIYVCL